MSAKTNPPRLDRIKASEVTAQEFFDKYVSTRKPCVVEGKLTDLNTEKWTPAYLQEVVGEDAMVQVEKRTQARRFGLSAPKGPMSFYEFAEHVKNGSDEYYLTTQEISEGEDGSPTKLFDTPVEQLHHKAALPARPALLGNLIPHNINLWMGHSKEGSSSGLHHDFHDNLYVLVHGRKRFRLLPPTLAHEMRTSGEVVKVHDNGLIHYSSVLVREDGASLVALAYRTQERAQQALEKAEEELDQLKERKASDADIKKAEAALDDREEELEESLGGVLAAEMAADAAEGLLMDDDDDDDDDEDMEIDVTELAREAFAGLVDGMDAGAEEEADRPAKMQKTEHGAESTPEDPIAGEEETNDEDVVQSPPDHFCQIELPLDSDTSFPEEIRHLQEQCATVELRRGDMLYLPCGWFHEVTSFTDADNGECNGHMALNYWMYPPSQPNFQQPYEDDFWQERFDRQQPQE